MKNVYFKMAFCLFMMCPVLFLSCDKDEDELKSDPEGTITTNISYLGSNRWTDYDVDNYLYEGYRFNFSIGWLSPDNIAVYWGLNSSPSLVSVGKVKGLGSITTVPTDGWVPEGTPIACNVGYGYIAKIDGYGNESPLYIRIYVMESIVSTTGGIMGAKIKLQYPFIPENI